MYFSDIGQIKNDIFILHKISNALVNRNVTALITVMIELHLFNHIIS